MKFTAWVPIDLEEIIEGHFYAGESPDGYSTTRLDEACPICSAPLELVKASVFGRIVQDMGKRNRVWYNGGTAFSDQALGLVELMPPTHEALSCSGCDTVFTRLKGADAYGPREAAI